LNTCKRDTKNDHLDTSKRVTTKDYLGTCKGLLQKITWLLGYLITWRKTIAWRDYLTTHKGFHKWPRSYLEEKLTNYLEEMSIGNLEYKLTTLNMIFSVIWYICHYGNSLKDTSYDQVYKYYHGWWKSLSIGHLSPICDKILLWMIEIWVKNYLVSDSNCNAVNL
jgi:hypothetical protein